MDPDFSPADQAFREEVRAFVRDNLPAPVRRKVEQGLSATKEEVVAWNRILHAKGWAAPAWPAEHGGTGWSAIRCYIFEDELVRGFAPSINSFGTKLVGPVIIAFGSAAQKSRYLPRILSGDDWWCQGYSEPNAGSDLASLTTRAVRDRSHYVVNGAKIWTTLAQHADMIFCLVRTATGGRKQAGISFLLIDMKSPGVSLRPIVTIDGGDEINEVRFDDARVPVENRIGAENKGWTYAKVLLSHERMMIADVPRSKRLLARLKRIAADEQSGGGPLIEEPRFCDRIAEIEIALMALEYTTLRFIAAAEAGEEPGTEVSMLKIRGSEVHQMLTEMMFEAVGHYAFPFVPEALAEGWNEEPVGPDYAAPLGPQYFNARKVSIYSGSNEIQKNIITKFVLGL